jgi:hypothetical protein
MNVSSLGCPNEADRAYLNARGAERSPACSINKNDPKRSNSNRCMHLNVDVDQFENTYRHVLHSCKPSPKELLAG